MNAINIISAIGNNDSIWPLLIRDCGCENPIKCVLTYKQNSQDKFIAREATREKAIDEYGASAVWLGGIPLISTICDKLIDKSGFSSKISPKLFNETASQGLNINIDKFSNLAQKEVNELIKVKNNKQSFQNKQIAKLFATTIIPIALMGFILPKINFLITKNSIKSKKQAEKKENKPKPSMVNFMKSTKKDVSFTGLNDLVNITNIQKMMITDVGLGIGRTKTERTKKAQAEKAFGAVGAFILNYITPKKFENGFNWLSKKIFNINTELDPKILFDKKFLSSIKDGTLEMPKAQDEKTLLDFIDNNPEAIFSQIAKKQKIVSYLDNNVRDPRQFVEIDKLKDLVNDVENFAKNALEAKDVEKFAKKALGAKSFTILSNIILSSFLLAYVLPKLQFLFRKIVTGKNINPGIEEYRKTL